MKQIGYYGIVALAGLSLLACNKGQDTPFEEEKTSAEGRSYTIAIAPDTKSYLDGDHMTWDDDDAIYAVIGWFATATEYDGPQVEVSGLSRINLDANPRTFTVRTELGSIDAGQYIYAYYAPYAVDNESKTAAQLSIQTEQQGLLKNAMPMVSLPISVEDKININTNEAIGTARFVNLGAVIEYNVYTSNETFADENVIGVTFEASTPIAGNFTVDLTQVSEDAIPSPTGLTENTVYSSLNEPVTVGSSKDNGVKVYQVIAPGTISGIITVTTDAAFYEYTISSMDFNRGKIRPLNVDLASANAVRLTEGERILVGSKWKLADYYESWADDHITDGYNVMQDVGAEDARFTEPRLVFHASGDFRMNHFHFFKDLENTPSSTPQNANGRWALSADNSTLTLSDGAFPISVTAQYPDAVDWTVVTLTSDELHLVTYNEEQWVNLVFVPDGVNDDPQPGVETSWDHTFDTGDFDLTDEYIWADPLTDTFDGMTWTLANNQGAYAINTPWTWSGTVIWNGWGWDYLPTVVTLSSSSFEGTITSVSLDYTVGQHWVFQAGCTVGGDVFGDIELCYNDDGEMPQQTVTFTGLDPASGTIVITITQEGEVHPILLRGVHVVYTPE